MIKKKQFSKVPKEQNIAKKNKNIQQIYWCEFFFLWLFPMVFWYTFRPGTKLMVGVTQWPTQPLPRFSLAKKTTKVVPTKGNETNPLEKSVATYVVWFQKFYVFLLPPQFLWSFFKKKSSNLTNQPPKKLRLFKSLVDIVLPDILISNPRKSIENSHGNPFWDRTGAPESISE